MNWKDYVRNFDSDTIRILEISEYFLVRYFGHTQDRAGEMLAQFFKLHAARGDEDFVHHQSSYRVAAFVHYVQAMAGDINTAGEWLVEQGHNDPPRDAVEYFREHFFVR